MNPSLAATTGPQPSATASPTGDPVPLSSAPPGVMLCREAWGARPARSGGTPQVPSHITIHHSAVVLGDNSKAPGRIREDQRYHQDSQGWIDIAYHVGVDRKGNIYQLRDPGIVGDTATSYDPAGHLLVFCEGNFDEEDVTEELLAGVAMACAWGAKRYFIPPETISGHRDFAATSCPGTNLYAHIASGEIGRRVEDLVATGAGDLQLICGPEAVAKVAAIEAGN
jgi:N-acetylmuramoyl-L-alanine amidase